MRPVNYELITSALHPLCALLLAFLLGISHLPMSFVTTVNTVISEMKSGWTVRGSNAGGGEIFRTCPDRPWGPPSLLCNGYRVFPGGKVRPGCDADPSPPSSAEVKNRVELYPYSPQGPSWPMEGWNLPKKVEGVIHYYYVGNSISKLQIQVTSYIFELSAGNCHR